MNRITNLPASSKFGKSDLGPPVDLPVKKGLQDYLARGSVQLKAGSEPSRPHDALRRVAEATSHERKKAYAVAGSIGGWVVGAVGGLLLSDYFPNATVRTILARNVVNLPGGTLFGSLLGAAAGSVAAYMSADYHREHQIGKLDTAAAEVEIARQLRGALSACNAPALSILTDYLGSVPIQAKFLYYAVKRKNLPAVKAMLVLFEGDVRLLVNEKVPGKAMSSFRKASLIGDLPTFQVLHEAGGILESLTPQSTRLERKLAHIHPAVSDYLLTQCADRALKIV
jgi:hypothetical protein